MPFSTYLDNALLGHVTGKTAYTMPTPYVALSTTTPTAAGGNVTEPSSGGYTRVAASGATWNTPASGSTSNASAITFPTATGDWSSQANFTYGVLYDAASGGNVIGYGPLAVAKNCLNGDTMIIAAGQLTITLS